MNVMPRAKKAAETEAKDEGLPKWAEEEIKSVQFGNTEVITRTGYILDIYEKDYKVDIQVYEPIPDGRSIVEGLDVPKSIKIADFLKGFVYEFKIKMLTAPLSDKLVELLKTKYNIDMKAIYKFELQELVLMDVESDAVASTTEESEDD
ncbi:MAG: hypothetical protein DA330_01520 [Nitrososphaera sp.]|nr:hypothetical protein [Nitrososphaera sp.]